MAGTPIRIADAELAVLQVLWERGPATIRQLSDAVYPGGGASEYGTVHKLLERLESKGCVRRERRGRVYLFHAALARDELIGRELETLVDKMCGGSLQPLLSNLIRARGLTSAELRDLLDLIETLDREAKRVPGPDARARPPDRERGAQQAQRQHAGGLSPSQPLRHHSSFLLSNRSR